MILTLLMQIDCLWHGAASVRPSVRLSGINFSFKLLQNN